MARAQLGKGPLKLPEVERYIEGQRALGVSGSPRCANPDATDPAIRRGQRGGNRSLPNTCSRQPTRRIPRTFLSIRENPPYCR